MTVDLSHASPPQVDRHLVLARVELAVEAALNDLESQVVPLAGVDFDLSGDLNVAVSDLSTVLSRIKGLRRALTALAESVLEGGE